MRKKGKIKIIVGIDEVGRGPLAGPVVAAAVTITSLNQSLDFKNPKIKIRDSKQLSLQKREVIYNLLKQHPEVAWGIGRVGQGIIDRINILEASKLAMQRAVFNLEKKLGQQTDFLLIDGNFAINLPHKQKSIIKGDQKVLLIMLASIIAKVTRDKAMINYNKKYPNYQFAKHKGYPTILHCQALNKLGPCVIHRQTFGPVKKVNLKLLQK